MSIFPPLPSQLEPSLNERIAEAKRLRGQIPYWKLNKIFTIIQQSAKDCASLKINVSGVPKIATIQTIVAGHFNLTVDEMISSSRLQRIARPRMIAMYLTHILTRHSFGQIGLYFNREHTTVMHSVRKIGVLVGTDKTLTDEIATLKAMVLK